MESTESTFDQSLFLQTCVGILNSPAATRDDLLQVAKALSVDLPARFTWRPRPDQPEKYDQQTAFYESESRGVIWLLGGNGAGTTETTMAKVAKLVRTIPAPRKDTPFWIIAGSYDQSMNTCWKEKLYGHGHITDDQVDWNRVEWYRPKSQLPFKVPLLPQRCQADKELFRKHVPAKFPYTPTGNWCLEFKSWRQGDHQMMAQSIGGFAFVEQFPWDVFTETMRGCREYFLPGSMLVEYTPVDPDLSGDIEAMIQGGPEPENKEDQKSGVKYLPRGWEVFHANTECALEAGHVAKEWFDQYFGMIPSESRDMRLKGLFASFEGTIYKTFDPTIHVVGDEMFEWIAAQSCHHRRGLDWGAGPHNAFAAVWGAKNHFNQWFIYDEYYSVDQEATVIDHLVNISQQQYWPENHPLYGTTYVDPARPDNIRLAQMLAMKIKQYGTGEEADESVKNMNITLARNSVFEGIEHIQWLLKKSVPEWNEFAGPDGNGGMIMRPRLFVHHSCTNLIREFKKYRWIRQVGIGKSENPVSARPEPLKLDDHLMDAMRYLCFSDDSKCGLTIESIKKQSKAAQTVHGSSGQNANWRDIISNHGELAGVGERYGRVSAGKRKGNFRSDVTSNGHGQD
jgi:hypothetical protein